MLPYRESMEALNGGKKTGLIKDFVVPFPYIISNDIIIFIEIFCKTKIGTIVFVLIDCKVTIEITFLVNDHRWIRSIVIPWRVSTIRTAIGPIFVPNGF